MLLSDEYKQTLRDTHAKYEGRWGATACRHVYDIADVVRDAAPATLLDYGSADGKFKLQARRRELMDEVEIYEYDPGYEDREDGNIPCDFVLCVDVLEHIEPDYLDAVLADIKRCTLDRCYLHIAMSPAKQILTDGRNAHLIVEDGTWWLAKLEPLFKTLDSNIVSMKHDTSIKTLRYYGEKL